MIKDNTRYRKNNQSDTIAASGSVTIDLRNTVKDSLLLISGAGTAEVVGTMGGETSTITVSGLTSVSEGFDSITITETSTISPIAYSFTTFGQ